MLRRAVLPRRPIACSCPSTSTRPLVHCPHSALPLSQTRPLSTHSDTATSDTTSHPVSLHYPAPLWEKQLPSSTSARLRAWQRWIDASRVSLPSIDPPSPPVSLHPTTTTPNSRARPTDEEGVELQRELASYIALREAGSSAYGLSLPANQLRALLREAKAAGMVLVLQWLSQDLAAVLEREGEEKRKSVQVVWAEGEDHRDQLQEIIVSIPAGRERQVAKWKQVWSAFEEHPNFLVPTQDTQLSLSFLARLSDVEAPSTGQLSLALQVLQTLVAANVVPASVLGAPPTDEGLSKMEKIQIVLMKTIVNYVIEVGESQNEYRLATGAMKRLLSASTASSQADTDRFFDLIDQMLESLRIQNTRISASHRPSLSTTLEQKQASISPLLLELAHSLLLHADAPIPPHSLLTTFAHATANQRRYDLLLDICLRHSRPPPPSIDPSQKEGQWIPPPSLHHPFLLYLLGDRPDLSAVRQPVQARRFIASLLPFYASHSPDETQTFLHQWKTNNLLSTLLQSRNTTRPLRALARKLYRLCRAGGREFVPRAAVMLALVHSCIDGPPRSSHAVRDRDSQPKTLTSQRLRDRAFAESVVQDYIYAIASPSSSFHRRYRSASSSSFSSPHSDPGEVVIDAYDLTALSTAYVLLSDLPSAAQVLQRLVAQKVFPDAKDLLTLLDAVTQTEGVEGGLELLRLLRERGVEIDVNWVETVLEKGGFGNWGPEFVDPKRMVWEKVKALGLKWWALRELKTRWGDGEGGQRARGEREKEMARERIVRKEMRVAKLWEEGLDVEGETSE